MWLPIYMIHLDLTFNISHPAAKKSIFLFVCLFFRTLFIYLHGFPHKHRNERTRPFAANHFCRTKPSCHAGEQKSPWDKTNRANDFLKLIMCSFCLFNLVPRALFRGIGGGSPRSPPSKPGKSALGTRLLFDLSQCDFCSPAW